MPSPCCWSGCACGGGSPGRRAKMLDGGWLFPGLNPIGRRPASAQSRYFRPPPWRQSTKQVSMHASPLSSRPTCSSRGRFHPLIQALLGLKKLDTTVIYTQVAATDLLRVVGPLEMLQPGVGASWSLRTGSHGRHLPPAFRPGVASPSTSPEASGGWKVLVGHRTVPHCGAGRHVLRWRPASRSTSAGSLPAAGTARSVRRGTPALARGPAGGPAAG